MGPVINKRQINDLQSFQKEAKGEKRWPKLQQKISFLNFSFAFGRQTTTKNFSTRRHSHD